MAAEALSPSIDIPEQISKELKLTGSQVRSVLALFEEEYTDRKSTRLNSSHGS